jgi:hypothetical protein
VATEPPIDRVVTPDRPQAIPPDVDHHVEPSEGARFHLTFLVPAYAPADEGGEAACLAHLIDDDAP